MKASIILALPLLAAAAATPPIEERQISTSLLNLKLDAKCLMGVTDIRDCVPNVNPASDMTLAKLEALGCAVGIVLEAVGCVKLL